MTVDHRLLAEWYVHGAVAQEEHPNGYPAVWDIEYDEYAVKPERPGDHSLFGENFSEPVGEDVYNIEEPDEFLDAVTEIAGLTPRERQVVAWIAEGNSVIGVDYASRMARALDITPGAARKYKKTAMKKLRQHWAADMIDAEGLVDPRYLEPKRDNEFVCTECHLIRHESQRALFGCTECEG